MFAAGMDENVPGKQKSGRDAHFSLRFPLLTKLYHILIFKAMLMKVGLHQLSGVCQDSNPILAQRPHFWYAAIIILIHVQYAKPWKIL
jgi:hypothetical protein